MILFSFFQVLLLFVILIPVQVTKRFWGQNKGSSKTIIEKRVIIDGENDGSTISLNKLEA